MYLVDPLSAIVEVKATSSLFAKDIVEMPKSIKYAIIYSPKRTLLGFKSQWITCTRQW